MRDYEEYEQLEEICNNDDLVYVATDDTCKYGLHIRDELNYFTVYASPSIMNCGQDEQVKIRSFLIEEFRKFEKNGLKLINNPYSGNNMQLNYISTDSNMKHTFQNQVPYLLTCVINYHVIFDSLIDLGCEKKIFVDEYIEQNRSDVQYSFSFNKNNRIHLEYEYKHGHLQYFKSCDFNGYTTLAGMNIRVERTPKAHKFFKKEYEKFLTKKQQEENKNNANFNTSDLNNWADNVKNRDNDTCVICGKNTKTHAHHILPKSKYPELAMDVNNGVTLCRYCHLEYHDLYELNDVNPTSLLKFQKVKLKELKEI